MNPIDQWHQIVQSSNLAALDALLADDCVFWSPVVHTPQKGKTLTKMYLSGAAAVFKATPFEYVREVIGEFDAVLEFSTKIDGIVINGVDIISWNRDGKINEFKVMLRPLKAVDLMHEKMQAMLGEN